MEEIVGINHVGLRVTSLEKSRAFYEKIGFQFIVGPIGPEPVAIMEHPSGVNINLILNASTAPLESELSENVLMDLTEKHTGFTHMALEVTHLEAVQRTLSDLQIPITEGPVVLPDGTMFLFVRDPDKNVIEFHQVAQ
jgi:lactoylglutathione lyase